MFEKPEMLNTIKNGAFLIAEDNGIANVMTIGWGGLMIMWRKPVFVLPVRFSRYTKDFLDRASTFTISVPKVGEMCNEIKICGTKSGRDTDKMSLLKTSKAKSIKGMVVDNCAFYYECKVIAKMPIEDKNIVKELKGFYADNDYHCLYFGEIIKEY